MRMLGKTPAHGLKLILIWLLLLVHTLEVRTYQHLVDSIQIMQSDLSTLLLSTLFLSILLLSTLLPQTIAFLESCIQDPLAILKRQRLDFNFHGAKCLGGFRCHILIYPVFTDMRFQIQESGIGGWRAWSLSYCRIAKTT